MKKKQKDIVTLNYKTIAMDNDNPEEYVFSDFEMWDTESIAKGSSKKISNFDVNDNLLIKGDNFYVLHALKKYYANKIKLIYIDPPYNTGNKKFAYKDDFSHSEWLTFMKNRLEVAKELLSDDGCIFVQCDDNEQAYLKVLMDEVFNEKNFQTSIVVKMSHMSGPKMAHKDKKIPKIKEFIHIYSKTENIIIKPQFKQCSWDDAFSRYNSFIEFNDFPETPEKWTVIPLKEAQKKYKLHNESVEDFNIRNSQKIFRTAMNRSADYSKYHKDKVSFVRDDKGISKYTYKHEDVLFASYKIQEIENKLSPVEPIGDIWGDIELNNLSNEGLVSLRFGKKPEALLKRVISLITQPNDIILDFFSGSGTTAAVAHKMGRRWIAVEQMDYIRDLPEARLKKVIEGEQGGISKAVNWQGGGSFVYCELKKTLA